MLEPESEIYNAGIVAVADDLTIRKLTYGNRTMQAKFAEAKVSRCGAESGEKIEA